MTLADFQILVSQNPNGVILLEGRRAIPSDTALQATRLAEKLAREFPALRFRSGNATGSDDAFALGIAAIDPTRLQIVSPYPAHRKKHHITGATYDSPESLSPEQKEEIETLSIAASPHNKTLFTKAKSSKPLAAKAAYLIRDTMKVTGHNTNFPAPFCALFYVNLKNPMEGGTGHTIRACQQKKIPVVFQNDWLNWS